MVVVVTGSALFSLVPAVLWLHIAGPGQVGAESLWYGVSGAPYVDLLSHFLYWRLWCGPTAVFLHCSLRRAQKMSRTQDGELAPSQGRHL